MDQEELVAWARAEVERLRTKGGQVDAQAPIRFIVGDLSAAIEFLHLQAPDSFFYTTASESTKQHYSRVALGITADALEHWAEFAESGLADGRPFEVLARIEASTDLMEQVEILLADHGVHPAAPIVLAGAALEEFLRSMMVGCPEPLMGKPGISSYASALRKGNLLTKQDEKDITAWAGQRNEAAHGQFDDLNRDRARIMVDAINLFLRQKIT